MERVELMGSLSMQLPPKHELVPVVLRNSMEARIVLNKKELLRDTNRRNNRKAKHA